MPDKKQAWNDLCRLTSDTDSDVRSYAADALGSVFVHVPDKKKAWEDLQKLISDTETNNDMRWRFVDAVESAFAHLPDKNQAWEYLHRLTSDSYGWHATYALGRVFSYVSDKNKAWNDLHRLTSDTNSDMRKGSAYALGSAFAHLPDKIQASEDLIRLTSDNDRDVRRGAADALGIAFAHAPHKNKAWDDLYRLTSDADQDIRWRVARALWNAFVHVPDKRRAWNDLHRLTSDTDRDMRWKSADALGSAFAHVPDKKQAWDDLCRLTSDTYSYVRLYANHSSGKVCIFRASESRNKDDLKNEIKKAIEYFEKASTEVPSLNPAKFCLPFYRSYFALTFKNENTEAEVQKYLLEAKSAVEGSMNKEKLLEVVENLGNALKEIKKARDFDTMKVDINAYRRYCDRACELLETTEEKAPGVSRLIRKGLPIIDERIKGIIAEIREKAKVLCKQVKDTEFKEIGQQVNNAGQELSKVINPIRIEKEVARMLIPLSAMCKKMPEEDRGEACEILKQINDEQNIEDKLPLISMFLSKISTQMNQKKEQNMSININSSGTQSRVNIGSVDKSTNLITGDLQIDLENLKTLIESDYHKEDKTEIVQAVDLMKKNCTDSSKKNTLKEKLGWILTRTSEVSSISSLVITLLQTYTGT
jgi:HEAT repeat protein